MFPTIYTPLRSAPIRFARNAIFTTVLCASQYINYVSVLPLNQLLFDEMDPAVQCVKPLWESRILG